MSVTNKVLYNIDQRNDTTPAQKETARKNIGAYEDKTAAGGIPKDDLASEVRSSLDKADSSVQSVTGYWHGAPDIVGEDTVAPFITSIEKKADDTVKYRTCSATVGNRALPVFMDSGVVTPANPHYMYPTVALSNTYAEVKRLVDAGYRPILVPDSTTTGAHTRYILTGAKTTGYGPAFIFTALFQDRRQISSESIQNVICQDATEDEKTWVWNEPIFIPNIPEPNDSDRDVGKVLTVSAGGGLYWDEPAGGNNIEVRAGTNNLHVTSADVNDQTIFTMSADYYHSSGNYAGPYTGPGTVIVDPTTMNLESTNSAYGYCEEYAQYQIGSKTTAEWSMEWMGSWNSNNIPTDANYRLVKFSCRSPENIRDDMRVNIEFAMLNSMRPFEKRTLNADDLRKETYLAIPTGAGKISYQLGSDSSPSGYANNGYNIYVYAHSNNTRYIKGELAWKDQTYHYVDEQIETREPRLPVHSSVEKDKILTVSGDNGELGWMPHTELPETSGSQYLIGDNGTVKWHDREKLVYRSNSLGYHTVTQEDLDAGFIVFPITTWNIPSPGIAIDAFLYFLVVDEAGYTVVSEGTGHPLMGDVTTLSIGYWNDDNTWRGGLLEDISGSDLPYRSYGHGSIRRTGVTTCPDSTEELYKMRGPAIRLNFKSSPSVGVGDKIKIGGTIIGIRIDGGLW